MKTRRRFSPKVYAGIVQLQKGICGCGCEEQLGDDPRGICFDHILPLWLGGSDTPDNLQALKPKHHTPKTSREAGQRAKIERIKDKDGLHKRKMNAGDKALRKILEGARNG